MELSEAIAEEMKKDSLKPRKSYRMSASDMARRRRESMKRRRKRKFGEPKNIFHESNGKTTIERIGNDEVIKGYYDDSPNVDNNGNVSPFQEDKAKKMVKNAIKKWAQSNACEVEIIEDENT